MVVDARIPLFHFSDAIYSYVRDDLKKVAYAALIFVKPKSH
jgi:hypothetical protein